MRLIRSSHIYNIRDIQLLYVDSLSHDFGHNNTQMIHHPMLVFGKDQWTVGLDGLSSIDFRSKGDVFTSDNMQQADYTVTHLDETWHMTHAHGHGHAQCNISTTLVSAHSSLIPCNTTIHTDLSYIKYAILYKIHSNMHIYIVAMPYIPQ